MAVLTPLARAILDALVEPAVIIADQRVLAANTAARRLLPRALPGTDVRLAIRHPVALEPILAARAADLEVTGLGGADRPWMMAIRPLDDGALLVRLADSSVARAAERMRVDFVANASHELRTPLATIIGYAETIAEDGGVEPELNARFGGIIRSEARRMLRIVEDLMSLSRIEADRYRVPREQVQIERVVEMATENARLVADQRGCAIAVDIQPGLAPVLGDSAQLVQLLDNLIANALRYGCGGPASEVIVRLRGDGGAALLSVSDQGEGIAGEHLSRLTERFYRVDDARSRDSGGTGLGLAIVKHIVERHRGALDIRSSPGEGTEVVVRLPLAPSGVTKV